jgi:hypothetical protein
MYKIVSKLSEFFEKLLNSSLFGRHALNLPCFDGFLELVYFVIPCYYLLGWPDALNINLHASDGWASCTPPGCNGTMICGAFSLTNTRGEVFQVPVFPCLPKVSRPMKE